MSHTRIASLFVTLISLSVLYACETREETIKKAVHAEVRDIAAKVALEHGKEMSKQIAQEAAKDLLKKEDDAKKAAEADASLPPSEHARRAFLESVMADGLSDREAKKAWATMGYEKTKAQFIAKLTKDAGMSAADAEVVWHHGQ